MSRRPIGAAALALSSLLIAVPAAAQATNVNVEVRDPGSGEEWVGAVRARAASEVDLENRLVRLSERRSSAMMSLQRATHSLQMYTVGPAISLRTSC